MKTISVSIKTSIVEMHSKFLCQKRSSILLFTNPTPAFHNTPAEEINPATGNCPVNTWVKWLVGRNKFSITCYSHIIREISSFSYIQYRQSILCHLKSIKQVL